MATTLPEVYAKAQWRCTLPYHADIDRMGVGFTLEDGSVMRVALDRESARHLAESLLDYLAAGGGCADGMKTICNYFDVDAALAEYPGTAGAAG